MDNEWSEGFKAFLKLTPQELSEFIRYVFENPEPGLVLRPSVRQQLIQQQRAVREGERGIRLEELLSFETDWREDPVREIQILGRANNQLMTFDPEFAWLALDQIYRLRPKSTDTIQPLKGGMVGVFKIVWQDYRILCLPLSHDLLLICDISRASDLFEPA